MEDEWDIWNGSDRHKTKRAPAVSSESTGKANRFLLLCFPEKLWKMLESDQFLSIWWSEGGKCVAINKDLFEVEVLGRGVCQRVFNTQHIRSVICQLNLYGFTKVQRDFQRSASLPEFLSEEAAASAHSQILYYYNPSFNRAHPWLLGMCKRRAALKQRALSALCLDEELEESCPSGSCQDLWPVQGTTACMEKEVLTAAPAQDTQVSAHRKFVLAK
ncbi:unnamed protein product, partial [Coccothraustes coccothraustes]